MKVCIINGNKEQQGAINKKLNYEYKLEDQ